MYAGVTGASGTLGKILTTKLEEEQIKYSKFEGDICSTSDLRTWLKNKEFTHIFHLAAMVPTAEVAKEPLRAYEVNVGGTLNLLSELTELKRKIWLFHASSSHIYQSKNTPISEQDNLEPVSLYGKTKKLADEIATCQEIQDNSNLEICCGRIFSFYHKTQQKPFLYPSIIERLNNEDLDKPFFLYGAESIRDFLNAEEVIEIAIKLMNKNITGTYNIASGKGIKIKDFVQNISPKKLVFETDNKSDFLVANIEKLTEALQENE